MLSSCSGAGSPPNPLRVVLNHLGTSKGQKQLYNDTARGVHRTSKDNQAAARATLRHLPLDKFFAGVVHSRADNSTPFELWPWDLLAASPEVTSWTVHAFQLSGPLKDRKELLAVAAGNLKSLEVLGVHPEGPSITDLGLLLHACTQLRKVHITYDIDWGLCRDPWTLLDPASSSFSTAVYPSTPLLSWESSGLPITLMEQWLSQQQPPGGTLTRLVMRKCHAEPFRHEVDVSGLAAVSGLRELHLDEISPSSLMAMHSQGSANPLRSLTRLYAPGAALEAICGLAGLQHLSLKAKRIELCSIMSSMQQLSCLEIIISSPCVIPADLGVWLPKLQRLGGSVVVEGAVPASLTALTHLHLSGEGWHGSASFARADALTCLKELLLEDKPYQRHHVIGPLIGVPALEVLDAISCSNLTAVQPLTCLRRLRFEGADLCDPGKLTVLGHLQQLSCLDVACMYKGTAALTCIGPLPALQQLTIGLCEPVDLGPWLTQCAALTKLCLVDCSFRFTPEGGVLGELGELSYLPKQLRELQLQQWRRPHLPTGVMQLVGLKALCVAAPVIRFPGQVRLDGSGPCELPAWLSQLPRLELLDIFGTMVLTEQPVLAHMPSLRRVKLNPNASAAKVCGSAKHLCYGGCSVRLLDCY
jgi:hypothetical protein